MEAQRYFGDCAECATLWTEYAEATREHFRLENKIEMASLRHDRDVVQEMLPLIDNVANARSILRKRIAQHLEDRHPVASAAVQG